MTTDNKQTNAGRAKKKWGRITDIMCQSMSLSDAFVMRCRGTMRQIPEAHDICMCDCNSHVQRGKRKSSDIKLWPEKETIDIVK